MRSSERFYFALARINASIEERSGGSWKELARGDGALFFTGSQTVYLRGFVCFRRVCPFRAGQVLDCSLARLHGLPVSFAGSEECPKRRLGGFLIPLSAGRIRSAGIRYIDLAGRLAGTGALRCAAVGTGTLRCL